MAQPPARRHLLRQVGAARHPRDDHLGTYAERWLANRKVKGRPLADRTREGYQDLLDRFILPTFGRQPIHRISREDVDAWYDRTAKHTPTYRARAYSLLRTILASAVDDEYLMVNPAKIRGAGSTPRASPGPGAGPGGAGRVDRGDAAEVPGADPDRVLGRPEVGELTELRRSDVDTKRGVIHVRRAVVRVKDGFVVKTTKSDAGVRDVLLPPAVMALVRQHLLEHTAPGLDGLLFPSHHDPEEHLRQSSLTRVFYPARKAAGRGDFRFHDLRHTHLTMYAQAGATTAEIKARGGHSTSQAALRYQAVAQGREELIVAKLSELALAHFGHPTNPRLPHEGEMRR